MSSVHVSTESKQDYSTPPVLVGAIGRQFNVEFDLDLAATSENTKCTRFIGPEEDSLSVDWEARLREGEPEDHRFWPAERPLAAWLNPPFRRIDPWMEKCREESEKGCRIVSLTLASIGTSWYRNHIEGRALAIVLRRRVTFLGQKDPYTKELMVTLWGFGMTGQMFWTPPAWAVREDAPAPALAAEAA